MTTRQEIDEILCGKTSDMQYSAIIDMLLEHGCIRKNGDDWEWTNVTDSIWNGGDNVDCMDLAFRICGGQINP